jgi:hypothetical protein
MFAAPLFFEILYFSALLECTLADLQTICHLPGSPCFSLITTFNINFELHYNEVSQTGKKIELNCCYLGWDKDDNIATGKGELASSPAGHPHPVQVQPIQLNMPRSSLFKSSKKIHLVTLSLKPELPLVAMYCTPVYILQLVMRHIYFTKPPPHIIRLENPVVL